MRKELITDAVLVKNYMSGDESALSVLINRHKQRIFSFIYSKVFDRDVAEDIFQDAFIKVIKNLKLRKYNDRRYTRNLTLHNGRGFSNDTKHMFKSYIKSSPALISIFEKEIAECQAEIAIR